jgi:hypothetical protein
MYRSKHLGGDRVTVYSNAYRTEISAPESGRYFNLQERSAYESPKFPLLIDGTYRTLLALCRSQRTEDGSTIVVAHYLDLTVDGISVRKLLDMSASMEIGDAAASPTRPFR